MKEINFAWFKIIKNIQNSTEDRKSMVFEIIGMMLNNISFVVMWLLFSNIFGVIKGWGANEIILMNGLNALVFGVTFFIGGGVMKFSTMVYNGSLDNLLTTPKSIYLKIITSKFIASYLGDMFFGLLLVAIAGIRMNLQISDYLIIVLAIIPGVIIFLNFIICAQCIAFFITDSLDISDSIGWLFFSASMYPGNLYQGNLRFVCLFLFPVLFLGNVQTEFFVNHSWYLIGIGYILAILWYMFALFLLSVGLKRYESGNMTGSRV